ncbi:hypothetical protein T05_13407 [Trichinella murrelli]|uniref:Uncharacterized protein n=1 Tax=Trichinella murrelli TaxID=144512 RepID=A0A0V0TDE7_9BILA|nr:hypothetical protein T05_13407 [Trichinella murrelli]
MRWSGPLRVLKQLGVETYHVQDVHTMGTPIFLFQKSSIENTCGRRVVTLNRARDERWKKKDWPMRANLTPEAKTFAIKNLGDVSEEQGEQFHQDINKWSRDIRVDGMLQ